MTRPVSSGLRLTFLLHALFGGVLGLLYLLAPEAFGNVVEWPAERPLDHRVVGLCFLAFAFASWLARSASEWSSVRIVTQMHVFWTSMAALLLAWSLLTQDVPVLGWIYVVAVGGFAVAFISAYTRHSSS